MRAVDPQTREEPPAPVQVRVGDPLWLRVVRWPLWSWRRLGLTVVAFVIATSALSTAHDALFPSGGSGTTAGAAAALPGGEGDPGSLGDPLPGAQSGAGTSAGPGTAGGTSATSGTGTSGSPGAGSASPRSTAVPTFTSASTDPAVRAAGQFVTAWARPDQPVDVWLAALRPLATDRLSQLLSTTDPGRVPATRVLGAASAVGSRTSGDHRTITVRTDAGAVDVLMLLSGERWLADQIDPAGQPPVPEPPSPSLPSASPTFAPPTPPPLSLAATPGAWSATRG